MALTEWTMKGVEFTTCNCDPGCPCQFNQLPSHGDCRAFGVMQVESGRYGDVTLDGLRWAVVGAWPKAIHHGNGTFQVIVDERADAKQLAAIEAIGQGRDTEPGKLIWQVFSTTVSKFLPTLKAPFDVTCDINARTATAKVGNLIEGSISPILNPVTKMPHRVRVNLPEGFEYTEAEYATGRAKGNTGIAVEWDNSHAHLNRFHWSTHGVVR